MNIRTALMWGGIAILLLQSACQNPTEPEDKISTPTTTSVKGTVLRNDNLSPVGGAILYDPAILTVRDTSKTDGSFTLKYEVTARYVGKVIGQKGGFGNDTVSIALTPGVDTTIVVRLRADSTSPISGLSSGKAANIVLVGSTGDNISIRGTGENETAVLTFEARDSLGVPVGGTNKIKVNFSILGGPGGSEYVFPASADTDPLTGRVTTRVTSGTKAGVLQVYATATANGVVIKSSPVRITISGGLPAAERFSLSREKANVAGGVYDNLRARITAIVGDKYGNPVQAGTAVYFTTTGGIIQPSSVTDRDGIASVDLITGNPRPTGGIAVVTAKTIGDSGVAISKSIPVLFSGPTRIIGPTTTVVVPDSGSTTFTFRVQDSNGFPLVNGTSIKVSAEGPGAQDLELFGDVNRTLGDTDDPAYTLFSIIAHDKKLRGGGDFAFKIDVTSQNGNLLYVFPGFVSSDTSAVPPPPPPSSRSGYASSLSLVNVSANLVSVRGTGAEETARLTFVARDSVGSTVDITRRAYVTFQIAPSGGLGGGEFLSPTGDSTNTAGQVSTTFSAGTKAGVLQIVARTTVLGRTITSSPVRLTIAGGLPVEERFSISRQKANIAGGAFDGLRNNISVIVGDKEGNPVRPTAIYFTTTGGIIQPSAVTDIDGGATVAVISGNPRPLGGVAIITARTISEGGTTISKSIPVVFSGRTRIIAPTTAFVVPDSGEYSFAYKVQDANGNPLTQGTSITVTVTGPGSGDLEIAGDKSVTVPDTDDPGYTSFFAVIRDKRTRGASGLVTAMIEVRSENGNASYSFNGSVQPGADIISPPPSAREPAQIAVTGPSLTAIDIAGVGGQENSVITYTVKDSLGRPIDQNKRTFVRFGLEFFANSYVGGGQPPRIIPSGDSTDNSGVVRASVVSGTQAGVVKLIATVNLPSGKVLTSEPVRIAVRAGDPTRSHFTFSTDAYAFATTSSSTYPTFFVQVADTFSNPVAPGTAVYFHTWAGNIQGYTGTDNNGRGLVYFLGGDPVPTAAGTLLAGRPTFHQREGVLWVVAQTAGKSGKKISDSLRVCWSIGPITATGIPTTTVTIPRGSSSAQISISLRDGRNNPLPVGTTFSASISFTSDVSGVRFGVYGDLSDESPYTIPNGSWVVDPGPNVTDFSFRVADLSTGGGATVGQSIIVKIAVNAPNIGQKTFSFSGVVQ